jgi:NitT/TauT family transport system ATP-binding protein
MNNNLAPSLLEVRHVKKLFRKDPRQELLVLDNINFSIREGEIVALLGRSGCGKSTLLRIIAGLTKASSGEILFKKKLVEKPASGIAMVFQHFALMPWLTVLQNVELGLEALGVSRSERRHRALQTIDMIGLDGFETAFPKELSGGMRQRVGLARALVVKPDLLLMDEPFSALDILTADNLRSDLINLWASERERKNSILLVTHNIEEAIFLADRAIILGGTPSVVCRTLKISLPHPRDEQHPDFRKLVNEVYTIMTSAPPEVGVPPTIDLGYRFPDADISELAGLIEIIDEFQKTPDDFVPLQKIADESNLDIDDLLSLTEVLDILYFAEETKGQIKLLPKGKEFADADILRRKQIFARHLLDYIPLIKHIYKTLNASSSQRVPRKYFIDDLEPYLSTDDANRVLRVIIEWGRYAELFAYNDKSEELNLENPE